MVGGEEGEGEWEGGREGEGEVWGVDLELSVYCRRGLMPHHCPYGAERGDWTACYRGLIASALEMDVMSCSEPDCGWDIIERERGSVFWYRFHCLFVSILAATVTLPQSLRTQK